MNPNVLVLCGGRSAERDVSCVSAAAVLRNMGPRYRPILVRIDPSGRWFHQSDARAFSVHPEPFRYPFDRAPARLEPGRAGLIVGGRFLRVDVVFPALHGPFGEDGTLQGCLEILGLAYVGSGVLGSAVGMDKAVSKRLALQAGLPVLPYAVLERGSSLAAAARLRPPLFVKPSRMGSSIGVSRVLNRRELGPAVRRAFRFDTTVIIEQGVPARELECAVLGWGAQAKASVLGEIRPRAGFYSYEAKYLDPDGARLLVPAPVPARPARKTRELALRAFAVLGCDGMARADFLMDSRDGSVWFNEINTLPGFTAISMYPRLWEASGLPFPRLVDRLIALALARHKRRSRLRVTRD